MKLKRPTVISGVGGYCTGVSPNVSAPSSTIHPTRDVQWSDSLTLRTQVGVARVRPAMQVWLDDCVEEALLAFADKGGAFRSGTAIPFAKQEAVARFKRYDLLDSLLASNVIQDGGSGRALLSLIVGGYFNEFIRQPRAGIPPLAIDNSQRPQLVAKKYWEGVPPEVF